MSKSIIMCGFVLAVVAVCHAEAKLRGDATVTFATVDEGRRILTTRDDFIRALSPFDRAARVQTDRDVSEAEFLEFLRQSVLDWTEPERVSVGLAFMRLKIPLDQLDLPWPKVIQVVKTTGAEEGGAPYTRGQALILPQALLTPDRPLSPRLLAHELFHILSRNNPGLRDRLYEAIGFVKCGPVEFPETLRDRRITNPDAPANNHCIRVQVAGVDTWAVPMLFARTQKYDVEQGGEFFRYLRLQFLLVDRPAGSTNGTPVSAGASPRLVEVEQLGGFYEQIGRNTQYLIHPEEVLADNFADLVMRNRSVASPEILKKLRRVLTEKPAPITEGSASPADK